MASFAKHLSTHLYFHMERSNRKQGNTQASSSGFQRLHSQSPSHRPQCWNKENDHLALDRRACDYIEEPVIPEDFHHDHNPYNMNYDWPEDYFSYSPYLLTPDLSIKSRSRRRTTSSTTIRSDESSSCRYDFYGDDEGGYYRSGAEYPRLRPPEPTSPLLDRREPIYHSKEEGVYPEEYLQDRFIVPSHMRGRFLPLESDKGEMPSYEMNEVSEPKVCIIIDFRENGSFASQDLPFPSTTLRLTPKEWLMSQLNHHRKSFMWVKESQSAIEGLLLTNVERHSQFPFISYFVTNTIHTDPQRVIVQLKTQGAEKVQHIAGYEEVATIIKPSMDCFSKCCISNATGYIISAFRVFPGEDREKLEKNWLTWTGARQVYKCLPKHLGLRKLTLHKKIFSDGGITYVLMCECSELIEHVTEALVFVDHLRARCCGYTALYRPVDVF